VGYNIVADIMGPSLFVQSLLPSKIAKSGEIPAKLTLQQFKVIQGHRSCCQSKAHMRLPISNFGHICYRFRDIDA